MNTDNCVVKFGCKEKEGKRAVSGEGCVHQEFYFLGLSGSQRTCVFAEGIDRAESSLVCGGCGWESRVRE